MEEKAWQQLHKNAASNIEQVLEAAPHKAADLFFSLTVTISGTIIVIIGLLFYIIVSWWSFTEVRVTANLCRSPGLFWGF